MSNTYTKGYLLAHILNCGTSDLSLLEDVNYDLTDITDELQKDGNLSLENIIITVFERAAEELQEVFNHNKESIRVELAETIKTLQCELKDENIDYTDDEEWEELTGYLIKLDRKMINPQTDISYYFNYLDTHIGIKNKSFYDRFMMQVVDDIEDKMGFEFEDYEE